jgi:hypothetical protein
VKQAVEDATLNDGQKAAVKSAVNKAGSNAAVKVETLGDGSLRITTQRKKIVYPARLWNNPA